MGFGLILILLGVTLIASWTLSIFYLVTGFFIFVLGIGAFAVGMAGYGWDRQPIPKVRCRQCYTLNYETDPKCKKCGASSDGVLLSQRSCRRPTTPPVRRERLTHRGSPRQQCAKISRE